MAKLLFEDIKELFQGNQVVIAGCSPRLTTANPQLFEQNNVIGVSNAFEAVKVNAVLFNDPPIVYPKWGKKIKKLKNIVKFGFRWSKMDPPVPESFIDFWYTRQQNYLPITNKWEGRLTWLYTSSMAAIDLAIKLGCTKAILCGFDLADNERFDKEETTYLEAWPMGAMDEINYMLNRYKDHIDIVSTCVNKPIPLEVPRISEEKFFKDEKSTETPPDARFNNGPRGW